MSIVLSPLVPLNIAIRGMGKYSLRFLRGQEAKTVPQWKVGLEKKVISLGLPGSQKSTTRVIGMVPTLPTVPR